MRNTKVKKDLTGQQFSHLTVLSYNNNTKKWICQCRCKKKIEVSTGDLNAGRIKSCGCMRYIRKNNVNGDYPELYRIYKNIKSYEKNIDWENYEHFKKWALTNEYIKGLSYKKVRKNEPYSKRNLIFGIKYNKKFLPIKEAKEWNIFYSKTKKSFIIKFRYNGLFVSKDGISSIDKLCSTHIKLYRRYFHKKSFFE